MISQAPTLDEKENPEIISKSKDLVIDKRKFGTDITKNIVSSDAEQTDGQDPQKLDCYAIEIFSFLHSIELKYHPQFGYLKTHHDITERMRSILVDWLVGVHLKFTLNPETLFLSLNLLDRYLERSVIDRNQLQLVGVTSMLIASKYEDIYAPEVKDFEYITDRAYSKIEILEMERMILKTLEFNVTTPSALRFLERYTGLAGFEERAVNMAKYLIELPLTEYKMLKYSPSLVAASSVYLTNKLLNHDPSWPQILIQNSPWKTSDLKPCARDICALMQSAERNTLQNVRKKYLRAEFLEVAKLQLLVPNK